MKRVPERCKHGHVGWMIQRVMFESDRGINGKYYAVWICQECARISNLHRSRLRRHKIRIEHSQGSTVEL